MNKMRTKTLIMSAALAAIVGLTGCRGTQEILQIGEAGERNPGACPRAFALYDAQRTVEFKGAESFSNVGFTGEIGKIRSLCRYYATQPIVAELEMDMEFGRGPAATGQSYTYNYWVAVTRKNVDVINKRYFPLTVNFPAGAERVSVTETIDRIVIPRANEDTSGVNFEIIVGFDVNEQQRLFNVEGKRFRVSVGQPQ